MLDSKIVQAHLVPFLTFLAVVSLNCCVICPALILDVPQYDSGVGRGKSLAFEAKLRAKKGL